MRTYNINTFLKINSIFWNTLHIIFPSLAYSGILPLFTKEICSSCIRINGCLWFFMGLLQLYLIKCDDIKSKSNLLNFLFLFQVISGGIIMKEYYNENVTLFYMFPLINNIIYYYIVSKKDPNKIVHNHDNSINEDEDDNDLLVKKNTVDEIEGIMSNILLKSRNIIDKKII